MELPQLVDEAAVRKAVLRQQQEPDDHDLSFIRERLLWTPEERLRSKRVVCPLVSERPSPGTAASLMTPLQADAVLACLEIASLKDIIRSKEAANRPKDLAALPILRQLLRELSKGD